MAFAGKFTPQIWRFFQIIKAIAIIVYKWYKLLSWIIRTIYYTLKHILRPASCYWRKLYLRFASASGNHFWATVSFRFTPSPIISLSRPPSVGMDNGWRALVVLWRVDDTAGTALADKTDSVMTPAVGTGLSGRQVLFTGVRPPCCVCLPSVPCFEAQE